MKRYLKHIHSKPPHERRQHALRIATGVTSLIFVGWIGSLGVRATHPSDVAGGSASGTEFANALSGLQTPKATNTLEVSTSTTYTGQ